MGTFNTVDANMLRAFDDKAEKLMSQPLRELKQHHAPDLLPADINGAQLFVGRFAKNKKSCDNRIIAESRALEDSKTQLGKLRRDALRKKELSKKKVKKLVSYALILAVAVAIIACIVLYVVPMIKAGIEAGDDTISDLYTPEIVQAYGGTYSARGKQGDIVITLESCSDTGELLGYVEFVIDGTYGRYTVSGNITEKHKSGDLLLVLTPGAWVEQPSGYSALGRMEVKIYNGYKSFECSEYDMQLSADAGDRYTIQTADDLKKLSDSNFTFQLKNDIDLSKVDWTPIAGFKGTLIGNGHTIKNLNINANGDNVGLFSTLEGTVRDLNFENAHIAADGRTEKVGILCGTLNGMVSNIRVKSGVINARNSNYVGSIAGYVQQVPENATISYLSSDALVIGRDYVGGIFGSVNPSCHGEGDSVTFSSITNSGAITGENYVGGVFGNLYFMGSHAITHYDFPAYLISIINTGDVAGVTYVGGIVGSGDTDTNDSYIRESVNNAAIVADAIVGCIGGYCDLTVDSCTNDGSKLNANGFVLIGEEKTAYVGGFVGQGAVITNCTNRVAIEYTAGGKYVAGVMGYSAGYPKNARMSKLSNEADISGSDYVGGIFGSVSPDSNGDGDSIAFTNMKNEGKISGEDYVGGILGYLYLTGSHAITHYDFPGYLTAMVNNGSVTGTEYVGGIIGYGCTDTELSEISDSTSTKDVSGRRSVGEIAGKVENITIR